MNGKRKVRKDDKFLIISKAKDISTKKYSIRWSNTSGGEDEYTNPR